MGFPIVRLPSMPGQKESIAHILAECNRFNQRREELLKEMRKHWKNNLFEKWNRLESMEEEAVLLLWIRGSTNRPQIIATKKFIADILVM